MNNKKITQQVLERLGTGVPKSKLYKVIGISQITFNTRLLRSNWKLSEFSALKEMGVCYE